MKRTILRIVRITVRPKKNADVMNVKDSLNAFLSMKIIYRTSNEINKTNILTNPIK